jgi:hypothetical protein
VDVPYALELFARPAQVPRPKYVDQDMGWDRICDGIGCDGNERALACEQMVMVSLNSEKVERKGKEI